jgi:quinol-cytochrome oxidoreductase complex cytochrome b subunit
MTEETEEKHEGGRQFLPNHLVDEVGVVFLVTGIVLVLASILKPEQVGKGAVESGIFPHIFFAGAVEMMSTVAPWFATVVLSLLVIFLFVLPFVDRSEESHPMKRKVVVLIVLAIIIMWLVFTILGF